MNIIELMALQTANRLKEELIYNLTDYEGYLVLSNLEYGRRITITVYKNNPHFILDVQKYNSELNDFIGAKKTIKFYDFFKPRVMSDRDYILFNKALLEEKIFLLEENL